jgi:hypothetical protein
MTSRSVRTALLLFFSAVIAVLGTATYIYQTDIQEARARVATGSSLAHTSCGPIEYAVTGDGPPVLVVHGAGGGFDQGLDFGAPLAKLGLRIIAMSRSGTCAHRYRQMLRLQRRPMRMLACWMRSVSRKSR